MRQMNKPLVILCFAFGVAMSLMSFPDSATAVVVSAVASFLVVYLIHTFYKEDAVLLTEIFLIALLARLAFGIIVEVYDLRVFFGGDSLTYDMFGSRLVDIYIGGADSGDAFSQRAMNMSSGWGMNYLTGFIYAFTGRNMFAAQSFCAVIGAATAPLVYSCAHEIFQNRRVGKLSAFFVALYPAFVIWSSQLLKDGVIIFLLVLAITMVLRLQRKFNYAAVLVLVFSMFAILSLRFYIFYMVVAAVVGTFVVGFGESSQSILRRVVILALIGLGLAYLGVLKSTGGDAEYANLERVQQSRSALAQTDSGFGEDLDVSTTAGAITALPIGFVYLMFAPFPWQVNNVRQATAMPEVILWWLSIPLLLSGLSYTIKHRLRPALSVIIFTFMLTIAYSVFQGNVGTAYRQRTQIQVFFFIFIAVGWTMNRERKENRQMARERNHRLTKMPETSV